MRLGILGGTFDPVHYGHLLLAEFCREQCRLDQLWFLPAAVPPHKQQRQFAPAIQRVEMLRLALAGHEAMDVCTWEIDRGGVNYTALTLEAVQEQCLGSELFFLMGADTLNELPTWYHPERVCQLAMLVVVRRAGSEEPDFDLLQPIASEDRIEQFRQSQVTMPLIELSSTQIRRRIQQGLGIRYQTPRPVEQFIRAQQLYAE